MGNVNKTPYVCSSTWAQLVFMVICGAESGNGWCGVCVPHRTMPTSYGNLNATTIILFKQFCFWDAREAIAYVNVFNKNAPLYVFPNAHIWHLLVWLSLCYYKERRETEGKPVKNLNKIKNKKHHSRLSMCIVVFVNLAIIFWSLRTDTHNSIP